MNTIHELYKNCTNKRVLVRIDANIQEDIVGRAEQGVSLLRIERAIPTIQKLSEAGARVVLLTHLGDDGVRSTESLIPLFELYNVYPSFYESFDEGLHGVIDNLEQGEVLLLQNVRMLPGETTCSSEAVDLLSSFGDVFVNDAFSASHRNHASIVGVAQKLPAYLGEGALLEIEMIKKFITTDEPLGVIMGGAKLATKIPLVNHFLRNDALKFLMLGGALAHPLYEALGHSIGASLTDKDVVLHEVIQDARVFAPSVVTTNKRGGVEMNGAILDSDEMIIDADPRHIEQILSVKLPEVKRVFWNGQLGRDDSPATHVLVRMLLERDLQVVIGGGDTLVYIPQDIASHKNIFVSTGGGALLDYLVDGALVGLSL